MKFKKQISNSQVEDEHTDCRYKSESEYKILSKNEPFGNADCENSGRDGENCA